MHSRIRRIGFLLLLCTHVLSGAMAQEVLTTDAGLPARTIISPYKSVPALQGARIAALTLPFFDDFSSGELSPDTNRWSMHPQDVFRPAISVEKGHNVPSKGVLTFDGANFKGQKYDATFSAGRRDTLTSQPIDLSAYNVQSNVALSFLVQLGGAGEAPDPDDSLVLLFDTTGNFDYMSVWTLRGTGTALSTFQSYFIPLDSSIFFHGLFRFKFVSYGSLNGELDQFHLDYVYLNASRQETDSQPIDVSPARFVQSPFYPNTAIPRKQFVRGGAVVTGTRTLVSNAGDASGMATLSLSIDDPIGGNVFSGTTLVSASLAVLPGFGHDTVNGLAFSSQAANMIDYGGVQVEALKTATADQHPENDTLRKIYPVDSLLALDDGVSDFGYGLTTARAFCQEFHIDQPDTLVAIWIHFAPTIHFNQATNVSTDLENKGFRLVVWDTLGVDSSLIETSGGMNVAYGTSLNQFIRYQLIHDTVVPTTFWVGLRQVDGMAIGIGYDRNQSERRIYYENASAEFQLSNNRGTLMIRPEFKVPRNASVAVKDVEVPSTISIAIAPHPVQGAQIGLHLGEADLLRQVTFELYDLQGRELQTWEMHRPTSEIALNLAQAGASGYYMLRIHGTDLQGHLLQSTHKILIQSH
jgi:hypothetical protein